MHDDILMSITFYITFTMSADLRILCVCVYSPLLFLGMEAQYKTVIFWSIS